MKRENNKNKKGPPEMSGEFVTQKNEEKKEGFVGASVDKKAQNMQENKRNL